MTLEQQYTLLKEQSPHEIVIELITQLGFEQRGGGPEGLYYTHPELSEEYLYRRLPVALAQLHLKYADKQPPAYIPFEYKQLVGRMPRLPNEQTNLPRKD